jgi:hypothetical protein
MTRPVSDGVKRGYLPPTRHAMSSNDAARSLARVPVRTIRGTNALALEQAKKEPLQTLYRLPLYVTTPMFSCTFTVHAWATTVPHAGY